jgi:hypothetical protein
MPKCKPSRSRAWKALGEGHCSRQQGIARMTKMSSVRWVASTLALAYLVLPPPPTTAAEAQTNRMLIEYVPPTNPEHQPLYELLKKHRALERLQDVFSPFQLPIDLKLRTVGCNGVSNAWYHRPDVSVCYEYLSEIYQMIPKEASSQAPTEADCMLGQIFYVFGHEMGHAIFDVFEVPLFGDAENAADNFSTYMMLQFGKDQAKGLITGAASVYKKYVQTAFVSAPLAAFSDVHAAPAQRFYNMICLAYGADPILFAEFVSKGSLPEGRARNCKNEYDQVTFAFRGAIRPHLDQRLEKQVLDMDWLPAVKARPPSATGVR